MIKDKKKLGEAGETERSALEKLKVALDEGKPARNVDLDDEEALSVKSLGLLTRKKMIYAANVADGDLAEGNDMVEKLREIAAAEGANVVVVSAQVEAELCELR